MTAIGSTSGRVGVRGGSLKLPAKQCVKLVLVHISRKEQIMNSQKAFLGCVKTQPSHSPQASAWGLVLCESGNRFNGLPTGLQKHLRFVRLT